MNKISVGNLTVGMSVRNHGVSRKIESIDFSRVNDDLGEFKIMFEWSSDRDGGSFDRCIYVPIESTFNVA